MYVDTKVNRTLYRSMSSISGNHSKDVMCPAATHISRKESSTIPCNVKTMV